MIKPTISYSAIVWWPLTKLTPPETLQIPKASMYGNDGLVDDDSDCILEAKCCAEQYYYAYYNALV